jgi:hypothetical protein
MEAIKQMPCSEYLSLCRAMNMIKAEEQLINIKTSAFPDLPKETKKSIIRELNIASVEFLQKEVKSFSEVISNFARKMHGR